MLSFLIQPRTQARPKDLLQRLRRARASGTGVYLRDWFPHHEGAPTGPEALAAAVMGWCRETVGATRRPWGIAHFDLALSTAGAPSTAEALAPTDDAHVEAPRSLSLRRLAPSDLYPGDIVLAEVQRYLAQRAPVGHLAVALFSWGDAAHEALRG
ncbi:MAG: hypothetical protein M0R73_11070 [Dehalococcoidia bacterium]|nr:hypothetical protein [Dehalococcoidia bacterium]